MMMRLTARWRFVYLAVLAFLIAGCATKSPLVAYYSLTSLEQMNPAEAVSAGSDIRLGVGPVSLPDYLKRSQIATRQGANRYSYSEFHRWAGMLEENVAAVLGENLGVLLATDEIVPFPWRQRLQPDYQLDVEILQFDSELAGDAVLRVRWAIAEADRKTLLASGKSSLRQPLTGDDYVALVEAESRLLAELSKVLAEEVKKAATAN